MEEVPLPMNRLPAHCRPPIPISILDSIARHIGAGLAIISRDFRTVWASELIKQRFGEVEGKPCYSTYNKRDRICENCGVREIFETGTGEIKHEQVGADIAGRRVWPEIIAFPIRDDEGAVLSALEVVIPVAECKHAEHAFRVIHAISQTINRSLDLEEVLDTALDNIMALFTPHSAFIRLVEPGTNKLVFAAQKGLTAEELAMLDKRQDRADGLTGFSIDSGKVVVIEDLSTDPRTAGKMGFRNWKTGCGSGRRTSGN
jgi:hypothetical protein